MPNVTFKVRNAGGTFDEVYFKNKASNIFEGIFHVDRIPNLNADKINAGIFSVDRIPDLDASVITTGTFPLSRIPSAVIGAMTPAGTVNATLEDLDTLAALLANDDSARGSYFQVAAAGTLDDTLTTAKWKLGAIDESGDEAPHIDVEVGDWVVCVDYDVDHHVFDVLNFNYREAQANVLGVVSLSDRVTFSSLSGNRVITESILKTVIDNANFQDQDSNLDDIKNISPVNNDFIVFNGSNFVGEDPATARGSLGLGNLATLSTINNTHWSGTQLAVSNGGTGAITTAGARTNLDVYSKAEVDAEFLALGDLASLDTINNAYWSGTDLAIANGGTGASDIGTARTNLDVYSKSESDGLINGFKRVYYATESPTTWQTGDILLETV